MAMDIRYMGFDEEPGLLFLLDLQGILQALEGIFLAECKPEDKGPGYSSTSYQAGYTYTSASYEKDGLKVSIWQDPDEDVMHGELARPGWDVIKTAAMCEDEDTGAVVSRLFWEAWLKCFGAQQTEGRP